MKKIMILALIASASAYSATEIQLDKTVVSSTTGFEKPIVEENKNIILITSEDISKKQYTDVESILRDTPNVVIQETEFGPVVNLRGSGERSMSRVKTMVDGVTITPLEEAMGTLPINSIPVGAIEKIEIIPGGGATLYGSGTTGGVVNIITKSNARKDFINADVKYGSFATKDTGIAFGQNITDNLYVNFAGQYVDKNGYRENEELESKSFNGGFDYKINDKHRVKFQSTYYDDEGTSSTAVENSILEHNRKKAGDNISSDSTRESFALDYEYKPLDNFTFYATAFKTKYERNFIQDDLMGKEQVAEMIKSNMPSKPELDTIKNSLKITDDVKGTMTGNFIEKTEGIKLKSKYDYSRGSLVFGYDYTATNLKRNSLVNTDSFTGKVMGMNFNAIFKTDTFVDMNKDTHALYTLNDYKLTDRLNLITGLRYEYSKYNGNRLTNTKPNINVEFKPGSGIYNPMSISVPSKTSEVDRTIDNFAGEIGLNYKYSDTGNIYSRYERGFISPLPTQLTNKINNGKSTEYQDSNLDSETIDSIEFGVKDFIGNSYVSATIFASQTNDKIATLDRNSDNPATKLWRFVNIGKTRRIGTEFYSEQYFDKLTLNQSISYVDAKITKVGNVNDGESYLQKGDKVPMVSDWKITLGADYNLTDRLSFGANYTYNSGYEKRELAESGKTPKTIKTSGYGVTDAYIRYNVSDYFTLKGGINNLFNEEYNYYETSTTSIPAPERNYYISGSFTF
ncbi:TonB-dependent receptor [Fusobacterium perfoetens]|uniref:TonB-dependent receptor n=1 Tax=Fusobacterium perfoetens TaxID=852 RepID=UPI001F2DAC1E|nr:TonB-dependent receptor [Fusobacterium perfoetens]MCF2613229.1 TonB-dependent receptor [Fusobacterium perfoetens]